jgi:hypothetical protein
LFLKVTQRLNITPRIVSWFCDAARKAFAQAFHKAPLSGDSSPDHNVNNSLKLSLIFMIHDQTINREIT